MMEVMPFVPKASIDGTNKKMVLRSLSKLRRLIGMALGNSGPDGADGDDFTQLNRSEASDHNVIQYSRLEWHISTSRRPTTAKGNAFTVAFARTITASDQHPRLAATRSS